MMTRSLILACILVMLVVPVLDQLACSYCGPSPETTATAKPVPVSEDDCTLGDSFERTPRSPDGDPVHIHFCVLHSTCVTLSRRVEVHWQPDSDSIGLSLARFADRQGSEFFHPPMAG